MKNLAILPSYFDYIFVHLRQKVSLRPELSPKFFSTLGPNPPQTRPEKPGQTYNSASLKFWEKNSSICGEDLFLFFWSLFKFGEKTL